MNKDNEIQSKLQELKTKNDDYNFIKARYDEKVNEIGNLNNNITGKELEISNLRNDLREQNQINTTLKNKINDKDSENNRLRTNLSNTEQENRELKRQKDETNEMINQIRIELMGEIKRLQNELKDFLQSAKNEEHYLEYYLEQIL